MRIALNITPPELKEGRRAYTARYWTKVRRIASTRAARLSLVGVVLLAGAELFKHPRLWTTSYFPLLTLLLIGMYLYGRLPNTYPRGSERIILLDDSGVCLQNLFGRTIRRDHWTNFAPVIETSNLYLLVCPWFRIGEDFREVRWRAGRHNLYVIPKRLLAGPQLDEFNALLHQNLRAFPEQIVRAV